MANTGKKVITVNSNQGQSVSVVGDTYRTVISGKETDGGFAVVDMLIPPGGGPGPHAHSAIAESFYVVDGEVEFKSDAGTYVAKKGSFVNIPLGGAVHCFKNTTGTNAHLLCTVIPSGLEVFFKEIGKPVEANTFLPPSIPDKQEQEKLKTIAEKYDQQLYPPDYFG